MKNHIALCAALAAFSLAIATWSCGSAPASSEAPVTASVRPASTPALHNARPLITTVRSPQSLPREPAVPSLRQVRPTPTSALSTSGRSLFCPYSWHSIKLLGQFATLLGGPAISCATVFNDVAATWQTWERPWFATTINTDTNWAKWKAEANGRRLVVTQAMIPSSLAKDNWVALGAAGKYDSYARTLAANLVADGLGNSYIRLGHEANGTWYADSVPSSVKGQALWRTFWAREVTAMRSVPGAHFTFVWNVNVQVRNVSLNDFYPGNAYVDAIGLDIYDSGTKAVTNRFNSLYNQDGGIGDVASFARTHGKPFALPEWGLWPRSTGGGGNDPDYIKQMALLIDSQHVLFSGYWYGGSSNPGRDCQALLRDSPQSLAVLRQYFGN